MALNEQGYSLGGKWFIYFAIITSQPILCYILYSNLHLANFFLFPFVFTTFTDYIYNCI